MDTSEFRFARGRCDLRISGFLFSLDQRKNYAKGREGSKVAKNRGDGVGGLEKVPETEKEKLPNKLKGAKVGARAKRE